MPRSGDGWGGGDGGRARGAPRPCHNPKPAARRPTKPVRVGTTQRPPRRVYAANANRPPNRDARRRTVRRRSPQAPRRTHPLARAGRERHRPRHTPSRDARPQPRRVAWRCASSRHAEQRESGEGVCGPLPRACVGGVMIDHCTTAAANSFLAGHMGQNSRPATAGDSNSNWSELEGWGMQEREILGLVHSWSSTADDWTSDGARPKAVATRPLTPR